MKRYIFILAIVLISIMLISNVLISEQIEVKDEKDKGVALGDSTAKQIIEVKDEYGNGVYSDIYFNEEDRRGRTDSEGILILSGDDKCKDKDKLKADPVDDHYEHGRQECNTKLKKITIEVTSVATMMSLQKNINKAIMEGKYGVAAFASSEFAARTGNLEKAQEVATITFELFAKRIEFPPDVSVWAYDSLQEKKVLTDEMVKAIEQFQVDNGLPKTGKMDYKTLSIAAGGIPVAELFNPVAQLDTYQ